MKLKITNFQSIADAELEFPVGITAIVGASNSGKTAVIRALTCLLNNSSEGKTFIRHGSSSCSVELEEENLPHIKWTRTLKDSTYTIDGELFQKVGKTNLFELIDDTGFCRDDNDNIINIQDEWSVLYPFGYTDSQVHKLFEGVWAMNNSSDVLHKIKIDESDYKKEIADLNSYITKNTIKINKIKNFLASNNLNDLVQTKEILEKLLTEFQEISTDSGNLETSLRKLIKLKKLNTIDFDNSIVEEYNNILEDVSYIETNLKLLSCNLKTVGLDSTGITDYLELNNDAEYLQNNIKLVNSVSEKIQWNENSISEYLELDSDTKDVLRYLKEYKELTNELDTLGNELKLLNDEYDSIGVCPLCNQTIKKGK